MIFYIIRRLSKATYNCIQVIHFLSVYVFSNLNIPPYPLPYPESFFWVRCFQLILPYDLQKQSWLMDYDTSCAFVSLWKLKLKFQIANYCNFMRKKKNN